MTTGTESSVAIIDVQMAKINIGDEVYEPGECEFFIDSTGNIIDQLDNMNHDYLATVEMTNIAINIMSPVCGEDRIADDLNMTEGIRDVLTDDQLRSIIGMVLDKQPLQPASGFFLLARITAKHDTILIPGENPDYDTTFSLDIADKPLEFIKQGDN